MMRAAILMGIALPVINNRNSAYPTDNNGHNEEDFVGRKREGIGLNGLILIEQNLMKIIVRGITHLFI